MIAPLAVYVDRLNEAKRYWVAPPRYKYGFLVVDVCETRYSLASESSECSLPLREKGWQGRPVRYACRGYWPCGASPRLRMPLGNGCAKQCISILAYRSFCRLDLEGKMPDHSTFSKNAMVAFVKAMLPATHRVVPLKSCVGPIDRNQPRW